VIPDADTPLADLRALLEPYPAELLEESAAGTLGNSPMNEGPQLLDPAARGRPPITTASPAGSTPGRRRPK
jgi:hypothetical protein